MQHLRNYLFAMVVNLFWAPAISSAQEGSNPPFTTGADIVSNYVWRGSKQAPGPAIQPWVELGVGNFVIGAWGSFGFHDLGEVAEADLYASYSFGFGLSLGISDYYYQGSPWFEFSDTISSHALEINAGYEISGFSISANIILNDASSGAGSTGGDLYFEAGYTFEHFNVFLGAGDGWHTSDGEFAVCNVGIGTGKEIKISDNFSLPVNGTIILNPEKEEFNLVVGLSF